MNQGRREESWRGRQGAECRARGLMAAARPLGRARGHGILRRGRLGPCRFRGRQGGRRQQAVGVSACTGGEQTEGHEGRQNLRTHHRVNLTASGDGLGQLLCQPVIKGEAALPSLDIIARPGNRLLKKSKD